MRTHANGFSKEIPTAAAVYQLLLASPPNVNVVLWHTFQLHAQPAADSAPVDIVPAMFVSISTELIVVPDRVRDPSLAHPRNSVPFGRTVHRTIGIGLDQYIDVRCVC